MSRTITLQLRGASNSGETQQNYRDQNEPTIASVRDHINRNKTVLLFPPLSASSASVVPESQLPTPIAYDNETLSSPIHDEHNIEQYFAEPGEENPLYDVLRYSADQPHSGVVLSPTTRNALSDIIGGNLQPYNNNTNDTTALSTATPLDKDNSSNSNSNDIEMADTLQAPTFWGMEDQSEFDSAIQNKNGVVLDSFTQHQHNDLTDSWGYNFFDHSGIISNDNSNTNNISDKHSSAEHQRSLLLSSLLADQTKQTESIRHLKDRVQSLITFVQNNNNNNSNNKRNNN